MINNGWWAGLSTNDMDIVADKVVSEITYVDTFSINDIEPILNNWKEKYKGIELELLSDKMQLIYTTAHKQQITTMSELLGSLSKHGQYAQKRWVVARELQLSNREKSYLVIVVPAEKFTAISVSTNGNRGYGILGKIFLTGLIITLIISNVFAFFFLKNISKRFTKLYGGIASFDLGNMDIIINDNSHDEIAHLAVSFNNMSERIKKQIDEEKAYQDERKKLISNISHDLRTPLTSIIGYSESLENNIYEDEEEKKKYIEIIRRKALYMEKLLGELLEFSRLESGSLELKKQVLDTSELFREILIEYLPILQDNQIELKTDIPDNKLMAFIDKDRISRVLRNLMDNALKYGKSGGIIELSLIDENDIFRFEVKDNGLGIDEKFLELIFKRFYRGDKSRNTKEGGMGLGLAIADEIVKMHGGRIDVESSLGEGSKFIVSLPKLTN